MALPDDDGLRLDESLLVHHARAAVFRFWRDRDRAPRFLPDGAIDAETEFERVVWRSRQDPEVTAEVALQDAPGGCTRVHVSLRWPPASGDGVAAVLGDSPGRRIAEELTAIDAALEADDAAQCAHREARSGRVQHESEASFPASDPPSWTPVRGDARP